jgi:type II secretion system protein N
VSALAKFLDKIRNLPIGPRGRKAIKIAGIAVLALISFVFALQLTFPYSRVKDKLVEQLSIAGWEMTVEDVSRGFMPGSFTLESVVVKSRPAKPDDPVTIFVMPEIELDASLLGLIGEVIGGGATTIDVDAKLGKGTVSGTIDLQFLKGMKLAALDLSGSSLPGEDIPFQSVLGGLPLVGKVDLALALTTAADLRNAAGSVRLSCPKGCTIGDGESKFKPRTTSSRQQVMVADGIEFGKVFVDKLNARAVIKGGKAEITKWEFVSKDVELHVDIALKLGKKFKDAEFTRGCVKYKGFPELASRDLKTHGAIKFIGGVAENPDDPASLYHLKLEGKLGDNKKNFKPKLCTAGDGTDAVAGGDGDGKGRTPTLNAAPQPGDDIFLKDAAIDNTPAIPPPTDIYDASPAIADVPKTGDVPVAPINGGSGSGSGSGSAEMIGSGSAGGTPAPVPPPPGQPAVPEVIDPPPPVAPRENE